MALLTHLPPSTSFSSRSLFSPSTAMTVGGGGGAMTYEQRARALLRRSHGGGGAMGDFTGQAKSDSIGAVVVDGATLAGIGAAFGAVDRSEYGKSFTKYIHGLAKPSTVALFVALGVRAFGFDKSNPRIRGANNATLKTLFPIAGYKMGERFVEGSFFKAFAAKAAPKATPKTAGADASIPGERTTA